MRMDRMCLFNSVGDILCEHGILFREEFIILITNIKVKQDKKEALVLSTVIIFPLRNRSNPGRIERRGAGVIHVGKSKSKRGMTHI